MKRRKHLLRIIKLRKKNKEKNKNKNIVKDQAKNLSSYSYKCGHRNIKLTVQRVEVFKKPEALESIFYYNCVFCGKDFDAQVQICPDCNRPLVKVPLKKCPQCAAKNNPLKQNCWVCNAPLPRLELQSEKETNLLLTLNVDGVFYRNTDKTLGLGMKKLFEDLISTDFSKEPLDAWAQLHESDIEYKKESIREECKNLTQEYRRKSFVYAVIIVLAVIIGLLIIRVFWSS